MRSVEIKPALRKRVKASKTVEELQLEEVRINLTLRRRVAYFLLSLFALNAVSALVAVYLVGFGLMVLSNAVMISLIGETVAHAAAMFLTVTKYLFPTK
jgi:hypothetical protein